MNIKYLFRFLTDHICSAITDNNLGKDSEKPLPKFGGGYHGFTQKISNLVFEMEFIISV